MYTKSFHSSERNFIPIRLSAMQKGKRTKKEKKKPEQSRTEQNFYFPSEKPPCFTKCVLLVTFISLFTLDCSRLFSVLQLTICLCLSCFKERLLWGILQNPVHTSFCRHFSALLWKTSIYWMLENEIDTHSFQSGR